MRFADSNAAIVRSGKCCCAEAHVMTLSSVQPTKVDETTDPHRVLFTLASDSRVRGGHLTFFPTQSGFPSARRITAVTSPWSFLRNIDLTSEILSKKTVSDSG
jgi:hypothetical protein